MVAAAPRRPAGASPGSAGDLREVAQAPDRIADVEQEPEPWIEINSADAIALGISDGDRVNVITARGNSTTSQQAITDGAAGFAQGFIARVGSGLQANQRVARGVVAIPWHWGDRGLSTGSRANDLCIDAGDANTYIPESKACLCKIEKL